MIFIFLKETLIFFLDNNDIISLSDSIIIDDIDDIINTKMKTYQFNLFYTTLHNYKNRSIPPQKTHQPVLYWMSLSFFPCKFSQYQNIHFKQWNDKAIPDDQVKQNDHKSAIFENLHQMLCVQLDIINVIVFLLHWNQAMGKQHYVTILILWFFQNVFLTLFS